MVNHTPLPWKYVSEYDEAYIDGPEPSQKGMINFYLCDTAIAHANAAFIVRACNNFETLLKLARGYRAYLDSHDDFVAGELKAQIDGIIAKAEAQ